MLKEYGYKTEIPLKWYTAICDIPNTIKCNYADDVQFCILENINVSLLISLLSCGNKDLFIRKELGHLFNPAKIKSISTYISSGAKLVPPTISYHAESNSLMIQDGRHRLRSAVISEQVKIPILISRNQFTPISILLMYQPK